MQEFKHLRPVEAAKKHSQVEESKPSNHEIEIIVDGEVIGGAALSYNSRPFPLYEIMALSVNEDSQGQGFGSKALTFIENFLKEKNKSGVLEDHLARLNPGSEVIGMYERHGWQLVPGTQNLRAYNLPKDASLDQLSDYVIRQHSPTRIERLKKRYPRVSDAIDNNLQSRRERGEIK